VLLLESDLSGNRMFCGISNNKLDFIFISGILRTSKINVTNKVGRDFKASNRGLQEDLSFLIYDSMLDGKHLMLFWRTACWFILEGRLWRQQFPSEGQ
jgi:hypothetical protein